MLLYHGTNVPVQEPRLLLTQSPLDFGSGFYLTSDLEQAQHWARIKVERLGRGTPSVSVFEVPQPFPDTLKILRFPQANVNWLKYVAACRMGNSPRDGFDIVFGPVADDRTISSIRLYIDGMVTARSTLRRLRAWVLKDQYAFRTDKSLQVLTFKEYQDA